MKLTRGRILTHLAVFGLAIGVAMLFRDGAEDSSEEAAKNGTSDASAGGSRSERHGRASSVKNDPRNRKDAGQKFSSKDFKAAWDAIPFRDLTMLERTELQEAVLREWAQVDLEGAIKALMATNWDPEEGYAGVDNLMKSFDAAFSDRPLEAWDLIQSGRLGLGSTLVKIRWAEAVAKENPMLVMSVLDELPKRTRGGTLKEITAAVAKNPELRGEFMERLCQMPQNGQFSTWMSETIRTLGPSGTPSEIGERLANATTEQQRTIAIHEFGLSLKKADLATALAEWGKLPAELQGRASRAMMLHADPSSDIPGLVSQMMRIEEWGTLKEQAGKISEHGYKTGKVAELAKWTSSLPDRPESRAIFNSSVEPFIVNKPAEAKAWIASLPAGDWRRDRALAEYSRHSLWRMNDRGLSAWAIENISDENLRREVMGARVQWAYQKGVEP